MSNYNIKIAAKLSGVSELSIRSWEGRYSAVNPNRTESNRRLYSDSDIEKLVLLKKLTKHGHSIGNLAGLSIPVLTEMLLKVDLTKSSENKSAIDSELSEEDRIVNNCIEVIRSFDDRQLVSLLNDASVKYSRPDLIENILLPLMFKIGKYWESGMLRVSHEHFTSAVIIKFLNTITDGFQIHDNAPRIIITTPEGQYHEVGALIGSSLASSDGWRTTYLGASLPAEDIAAAVIQLKARTLYLSIVYPADDLSLNIQLRKLREMVGDKVFIFASGNGVIGYKNTLSELDILTTDSPNHFREILMSIRKQINPNNEYNND
ncbi:MAG: MerR family transcriptional regulator [Ignavibacteriales bacterium]|nr:MerR family transcriptional regulator [Ignavibacteriales bacterium]